MEKRIKEYEQYLDKHLKFADERLVAYHREMLKNFQHERLVHLIIMLFFIMLTLGLIGTLMVILSAVASKYWWEFSPLMVMTLIMAVLSVFYVKHYYFLENHIQKLYDKSRELYERSK